MSPESSPHTFTFFPHIHFIFYSLFYFYFLKFIYLIYFWLCRVFVAACELFSSCSKQGLFFAAVCRLLIVVASLVVEHGP